MIYDCFVDNVNLRKCIEVILIECDEDLSKMNNDTINDLIIYLVRTYLIKGYYSPYFSQFFHPMWHLSTNK